MKKNMQLGMNASTASGRLVKDILYSFVAEAGHVCFRCGQPLTRDDFSIEHKEPWLDSADPVGLYFDLDNIAYSHRVCNYAAGRKPNKVHASVKEAKAASCRRVWARLTKEEQQALRRDKYKKYGC